MPRGLLYLTPMVNGVYRAECHHEGCGWWIDCETERSAMTLLRVHGRSEHKVHVTRKEAVRGTR
jgi:hypothetical protein